jgi:hypothetical protein
MGLFTVLARKIKIINLREQFVLDYKFENENKTNIQSAFSKLGKC